MNVVPGSGTVETSDTVKIAYLASSVYDFSLHVLNGYTYIGTATIRKPTNRKWSNYVIPTTLLLKTI
ncbi:MAG: hypothetical protein IPG99_06260 [Ignavibacteria bacterium]|nr:hypothetical protein [Ignavibacteria bacterium]